MNKTQRIPNTIMKVVWEKKLPTVLRKRSKTNIISRKQESHVSIKFPTCFILLESKEHDIMANYTGCLIMTT